MCGNYTKDVWKVKASRSEAAKAENGHTTIRKTIENYSLCYSCYDKIIKGFMPKEPNNELSKSELESILAAEKE